MEQQKNLTELKIGESAMIVNYATDNIPTKIYDLGLLPGTNLKMFKKAPFNGPVCISYGDTNCKLALRKEEAATILVETIHSS